MTKTQSRERADSGVVETIRKLDVALRPLPCLKMDSPFLFPHAQNLNRDFHPLDDIVVRLRVFEHEQGQGLA